jgi:chemotaxis protein histidine kinase CheA/CheY-like chemotaxis protein
MVDDLESPESQTETSTEVSLTDELLTMVDDLESPESQTEASTEVSLTDELLTMVDDLESPELGTMVDEVESSETSSESETSSQDELVFMMADLESKETSSLQVSSGTDLSPEISTPNPSVPVSPIERILKSIWTGEQEKSVAQSSRDEKEKTNSSVKIASESKTQAPEALPSIRVAVKQLDSLSHTIGELLISENQQNLQSDQIHRFSREAIEQFLHSQQQLNEIRDWCDRNLILIEKDHQGQQKTNKLKQSSSISSSFSRDVHSEFDPLEMDVYSDLHSLVQKLTEQMVDLGEKIEALEGLAQNFRFNLGKRKQLLSGAQDDLFQARMVPLTTVLNRFPRLLQQMIASHQKPAQLEFIGANVLVDKIIIEKIYDPLLHLIRNAYDHGLESPENRRQQGKSETGKITIKAYHQGNRTVIEIKDDGQGLNWERIRLKAVEKNLLTSQQAANASEAQLAEVLFEPGFSTVKKISQLSGRGVGLDVVRTQLEALQGKISVNSQLGQGTTFVLQLPLSLTTARLLICESQGIIYALLSEVIDQVLLPQPDRLQRQQSSRGEKQNTFLCWQEESEQQLIPIYAIADLINYQYPTFFNEENQSLGIFPLQPKNSVNPLLMLKDQQQRLCLQVDRILVEQELVIKSLGNTLNLPNYIQGYSVLGDGGLTLVIDPTVLVTQISKSNSLFQKLPPEKSSASKFLPSLTRNNLALPAIQEEMTLINQNQSDRSYASEKGKILVVDDSIVQRQTLAQNLQKAGYQILQAGNGKEALAQLNRDPEIKLIICDIEMPEMNGFEFLSHWRQDTRFAEIPVMMLTTRSGTKHRNLALALGAKVYFTKPCSEQELLTKVAELAPQSPTPTVVG